MALAVEEVLNRETVPILSDDVCLTTFVIFHLYLAYDSHFRVAGIRKSFGVRNSGLEYN